MQNVRIALIARRSRDSSPLESDISLYQFRGIEKLTNNGDTEMQIDRNVLDFNFCFIENIHFFHSIRNSQDLSTYSHLHQQTVCNVHDLIDAVGYFASSKNHMTLKM